MKTAIAVWAVVFSVATLQAAPVATTEELVAAVGAATAGSTVEIAAGTFTLKAPLEIKSGVTIRGAGIGRTVLTGDASWKPALQTLPDPEVRTEGLDSHAYLIRLNDKAADVTVSHLTLRGPQLHGALYGFANTNLHLHDLRIEDVLWAGVRTLHMKGAKIHDCEFVDAGGRWERGGVPGLKGGITAGAIFAAWTADCEISHNRFTRTQLEKSDEFYGIKIRQAKRCRFHHNTIAVNFSLELPFENDEDVEIDHNICHGTISIPKYAGGPVPASGRTFHIHHNWMRDSYSIEFVRNGVEIDHNLFDFDVARDHGNLISGFGKAAAKGPAQFHDNLVRNPGRGVIWINEPYANLDVFNNHVITQTTVTPRTEGLFGFNPQSDFATIRIRNNIIECRGQARPLFRREESYAAAVENNRLTNVADQDRFPNVRTTEPQGPTAPLAFTCGVHGEITISDWEAKPTKAP